MPLQYSCNSETCGYGCDSVFSRVHLSFLTRGKVQITWDMDPVFADSMPWTFEVQRSNGPAETCDWVAVAGPIQDSCIAYDDDPSLTGLRNNLHYRIKLTTSRDTYLSEPVGMTGVLTKRDWILAREILRRETLRAKLTASPGYLIKRRLGGEPCTRCLAPGTQTAQDPNCPVCQGTGTVCGYYRPIDCVWADFGLIPRGTNLDTSGPGGTVSDQLRIARMPMYPFVGEQDIWVNRQTDERFRVISTETIAQFRAIPIIVNAKLFALPFSDPVYDLPVLDQMQRSGQA